MAFGRFNSDRSGSFGERPSALADINMTPLIDIMLVLLVVFILTAPLFSHAISLDLPKADAAARSSSSSPPVAVAIDRHGQLFWNGKPIPAAALAQRFAASAAQQPQPDVSLSADQSTPYSKITTVMAAAQHAGLSHFGFVVDSPR